jgi:hypothetical protein
MSDFISAKVVAGCFGVGGKASSFAGGGGGGAVVCAEVSPRGPRGSDSKSRSDNLETIDEPRREPVGRRPEASEDLESAGARRVADDFD